MYRIRFHGRGGQGMKTASRILGTAFFLEGYEVQDAPRYGAERRGAPIFAFVRADKNPVHERGVISSPDLVIVADDSLVAVPAAGVLQGMREESLLLINSHESQATWQHRLAVSSPIIILPADAALEDRAQLPFAGATCAGAAARLLDVISRNALTHALQQELDHLDDESIQANLEKALEAYDAIAVQTDQRVIEGRVLSASSYADPQLIRLPFEDASISAPVIHAGLTSVKVNTGLWRTMRPVIDHERCNRCWWICSTFCPDSCIDVIDGSPEIDYDHCKGCMICVGQCPVHAIGAIPETAAVQQSDSVSDPSKQPGSAS